MILSKSCALKLSFSLIFSLSFLITYSQNNILGFDFEKFGFMLDSENYADGSIVIENITGNVLIIEELRCSSGLTMAQFDNTHLPIILVPSQKFKMNYRTSILCHQFGDKLEPFLNGQKSANLSFYLSGCTKIFKNSIESDSSFSISPLQPLNPKWIKK